MQMKTAYSAVSDMAYALREDYRGILARADDLQGRQRTMQQEVSSSENELSVQKAKAGQIEFSAKEKAAIAEQKMNTAMEQVEKYERKVEYIYSHPIRVTVTDENGNSHTEEHMDYAALQVAESNRARAQQEYDMYRREYEAAEAVRAKAESLASKIDTLLRAVTLVRQDIEHCQYEFGKYRDSFGNEADYNIGCLVSLLESLGAYVACKPFKLTTGLHVGGVRTTTGSQTWSAGGSGSARSGGKNVAPAVFAATGAEQGSAKPAKRNESANAYPYRLCSPKFCVHCTAADRAYIAGYADALFEEYFKDGARTEATLVKAYGELDKACEKLFPDRAKPNDRMMCAIRVTLMQLVEDRTDIKLTEEKRLGLLSGR